PKICGNLSLLSTAAAPQPRITQAPPPPPPPAAPQPPTVVIIEPPPPPAPAPAPAPVVAPTTVSNNRRPWIATAFVGTSMDMNLGVNPLVGTTLGTALTNNEDLRDVSGSLAAGGQIAYVRRHLGGEFTADFSPDANIFNAFLADEPHINSFMGNVIGTVSFRDGQFRPYITAGLGAVMMHTRVFTSADITNLDTVTSTASRFGSNIGAGLWIFSGGTLGVRADFRHYTTTATSNPDLLLENPGSSGDITKALVSGLNFWRTDVGVAFRW
ncbi:MAG TPA: acyloxyacyl hydrolase, partial [Vicinamibacterales bacterium]